MINYWYSYAIARSSMVGGPASFILSYSTHISCVLRATARAREWGVNGERPLVSDELEAGPTAILV